VIVLFRYVVCVVAPFCFSKAVEGSDIPVYCVCHLVMVFISKCLLCETLVSNTLTYIILP